MPRPKLITDDIRVIIKEGDALAEAIITAFELNHPLCDRQAYLSQTAADLYDRVYLMTCQQPDAPSDDQEVSIELQQGVWTVERGTWSEDPAARKKWLRNAIWEIFSCMPDISDIPDEPLPQ